MTETNNNINKFIVYSPLTQKNNTNNNNSSSGEERLQLTGIASTTNQDLQKEIVSTSAMKSMTMKANTLNIHGDHQYDLQGVIGTINNSYINETNDLCIDFTITKKYTPIIRDLLETGVKLGLSIGGNVTSYDEATKTINDIDLLEISLTSMPANWDTMGTVTTSNGSVKSNCLTGACYNIIQKNNNILSDNMVNANKHGLRNKSEPINIENKPNEENKEPLTRDEIVGMINEAVNNAKEEILAQIKEEEKEPEEKSAKPEKEEEKEPKEEEKEPKEEEKVPESEPENTEEEDDKLKPKKSLNTNELAEAITKNIFKYLDEHREPVSRVPNDYEPTETKTNNNKMTIKQIAEQAAKY